MMSDAQGFKLLLSAMRPNHHITRPPRLRLAVVPGHPLRRAYGHFRGVPLQFGEIVEGIDPIQFAGVDQAHEEVAHPRPIQVL